MLSYARLFGAYRAIFCHCNRLDCQELNFQVWEFEFGVAENSVYV
jgi:hypothetical protein